MVCSGCLVFLLKSVVVLKLRKLVVVSSRLMGSELENMVFGLNVDML